MIIKNKSLLYCPDCGGPLSLHYKYRDEETGEDCAVYLCRKTGEMYSFETDGEYLYCVCLYTKKRTCYGLASQNEK